MDQEAPTQKPEGALIEAAQRDSGLSIRLASKRAGMSDARWRQIVKGAMHVQGAPVDVVAPAATLARMAQVVGVTPSQLRTVGRIDAAEALERQEAAPQQGVTYTRVVDDAMQLSDSVHVNDEIELIYASKSMTAQQKLDAIRMVLKLRAQVDTEMGSTSALNATAEVVSPVHVEEN